MTKSTSPKTISSVLEELYNIGRHEEAGGLTDRELAFTEALKDIERIMEDVIGDDENQVDADEDWKKTHNYAVVTRNDQRKSQRQRLKERLK